MYWKVGGYMLFITLRSKHLKSIFALTVAIALTIIGGVVYVVNDSSVPASKMQSYSLSAETPEDRQSFFNQVGFEVNPVPIEVREIIIPEEFDEIYTNYNELQKSQSLDLTPYKGLRVKVWSYEILNYPGYENSGGKIRGNILTHKGTVIACDVSDIGLNGFTKRMF